MRIEWGQNLFEAERGVEKKEKKGDCERSDDQMLHSTFVTSSLQPNWPFLKIPYPVWISSSILQTWKNKWVVELFDHLHQGETKHPFQVFVEQKSEISN